MTDFEDVIRAAALKNGYGLEKSDPQMVLVTVLNHVVNDWQTSMEAALEKYRNEHEAMAHRWRTNAAAQSEKVLKAALDASREAMTKGMNEGTERVMELVQGYVRDVLHDARAEQKAELQKATDEFQAYVKLLAKGSGVVLAVMALLVALI